MRWRSQTGLTMNKGWLGATIHDYRRKDTARLFASCNALDVNVNGYGRFRI